MVPKAGYTCTIRTPYDINCNVSCRSVTSIEQVWLSKWETLGVLSPAQLPRALSSIPGRINVTFCFTKTNKQNKRANSFNFSFKLCRLFSMLGKDQLLLLHRMETFTIKGRKQTRDGDKAQNSSGMRGEEKRGRQCVVETIYLNYADYGYGHLERI